MNPQHPFDLAVALDPSDHVLGADHAAVTVVEYGDFECPICKQAALAVKLALERFAGRIRFAFRHFPLTEVHPHALLAAEAAEAAGAQGRFWEMHDLLFDNQLHLKPKQLRGYAERLELDLERYDSDIGGHLYLQRVREHMEGGRRSHVRGTPGFFVNGRIQDASFGPKVLFDAIEAALKGR